MTATVLSPPVPEDRTSSLPLRLLLAPAGTAPALLDGAWWPRSRDLMAELPSLTAFLDPLWGRITHVTVNPTFWPVIPRKVPVKGHVVGVGWFKEEQDPHKLLLLSYTTGRWDLLVIPPETGPATAARLMTEAADPFGTLTASGLMGAAEQRRIAADADSALISAWDSEGGHGARLPTSHSPARVVASVPDTPEGN
ncbi:DUF5994 family protein [Streptomyces caniferus]|uniref:DUF5994 family protein n=1 Tax=Streptomyces caniferus TaxID=285557 RepID=A0A640SHB8_9ACTN|nr:DUF5994 family protein [Streptomyces caniferus]GFE10803.1 hypothetical protein Scani_70710 [Streptomyces caniferus]